MHTVSPRQVLLTTNNDAAVAALVPLLAERNCRWCHASDSRAAIRTWCHQHPDLLILDLALPDHCALKLLKLLHSENPLCPILVLAAHDADEQLAEALELGASNYLLTPLTQPVLTRHGLDLALGPHAFHPTPPLRRALQDTQAAVDQRDSILRCMAEGLILSNRKGRILLANRAAEHLLQSSTPLQQLPVQQVLAAPPLQRSIRQAWELCWSPPIELELPHPDGPPKVLQLRSTLAHTDDGTEVGVLTLLRDITRERESDRLKNSFISMAAHEFGTPLTAILGFAELLLAQKDEQQLTPEREREYLGHILDRAEALAILVEDLLDLGRIQAGRPLPLRRELLPIGPLVARIVQTQQPLHPQHHLQVTLRAADTQLWFDSRKLEQALTNLLSNAIKYSPQGGTIRITGQRHNNHYRLGISDSGVGMTTEQMEQAFEAFYRARNDDPTIRGLGLGLPIVKSIIEGLGGDISLSSRLGSGTRVVCDLPLPSATTTH